MLCLDFWFYKSIKYHFNISFYKCIYIYIIYTYIYRIYCYISILHHFTKLAATCLKIRHPMEKVPHTNCNLHFQLCCFFKAPCVTGCMNHSCSDVRMLGKGFQRFTGTFSNPVISVTVSPSTSVFLAEPGAVDMQDEIKIKHIRRAYACSAFDSNNFHRFSGCGRPMISRWWLPIPFEVNFRLNCWCWVSLGEIWIKNN